MNTINEWVISIVTINGNRAQTWSLIFDNLDLDENFQNCLRLLIAYGTIFIFTRDNPVVINFEFTDYIKLTQVGAYPRTN